MPHRRSKHRPSAKIRPKRFRFKEGEFPKLTHYLFRYPAKFHPPVARALVARYSKRGETILDPFCGSGTILVEARALERDAIGLDIDPVAVFISKAKNIAIGGRSLRRSAEKLVKALEPIQRYEREYQRLKFFDISARTFREARKRYRLTIPDIPNLTHWFRKYVVIDLARIRKAIRSLHIPKSHKLFFMACFCSVIRNVSNADPVPVSGLEVTSHMKAKDAKGRVINPCATLLSTVTRAINDAISYSVAVRGNRTAVRIGQGDAATIRRHVRKTVDVVLTSPPYHNAVDYYRRHTLEMYWLDFVRDQADRLELLPRYIGRSRVPQTHPFLREELACRGLAAQWERRMRLHDRGQADGFKHYVTAMKRCLRGLAGLVSRNGKVIFVVGKSSWNGVQLPTTRLFQELAMPHFRLIEHGWYPLRNRYMTYSRRNNASIDKEHVLVFERLKKKSILAAQRSSDAKVKNAGRPSLST